MEENTELLTHEATDENVDRESMSLLSMEGGDVTVCFDRDRTETARMSMQTYDSMTEGESWESIGFVEV